MPLALCDRMLPWSVYLVLERLIQKLAGVAVIFLLSLHVSSASFWCLYRKISEARDVFAAFKDAALRVSMEISYVKLGQAEKHPVIMPEAFLSALCTNNRLDLLLPEKSLAASAPVLKEYWRRFKLQFGADHEVFQNISDEDEARLLPVKIHGDEGRSASDGRHVLPLLL